MRANLETHDTTTPLMKDERDPEASWPGANERGAGDAANVWPLAAAVSKECSAA
jgi:hypothetical protein